MINYKMTEYKGYKIDKVQGQRWWSIYNFSKGFNFIGYAHKISEAMEIIDKMLAGIEFKKNNRGYLKEV